MRTLAIGDIHGNYKALEQCLEESKFDKENDKLIVLGDVCDGYPETRECIEELLSIKHCELIKGNHDAWALEWALRDLKPDIWTSQGGFATIDSYKGDPMKDSHIKFLESAVPYLEIGDQLFVHGGFDPEYEISKQSDYDLMWDRELFLKAYRKERPNTCRFGGYKDIFIGHTDTNVMQTSSPIHACNVWAIDTGAGWKGKLTIMDIKTKEFWQSEVASLLYRTSRI